MGIFRSLQSVRIGWCCARHAAAFLVRPSEGRCRNDATTGELMWRRAAIALHRLALLHNAAVCIALEIDAALSLVLAKQDLQAVSAWVQSCTQALKHEPGIQPLPLSVRGHRLQESCSRMQ